MKKISVVLFLFLTLLMACNKEEKCPYTQSTIVAPESEVAAVQQYLTTNNITGTSKHPNGFFYKIDVAGTGNTPDMCSQVGILYKGQLTNGTVFDETTNGQMAVFTLGELIPGWKLGIPLIKPGGGK